MKIFLKLLAINIKVNFGLSALRDFFRTRSKTRALPQAILITLAIALGGGSFIVMYSFIADNIFKAGNVLGQPEIVLTLAFLICQMMMIFFGIFYMMSAFYFSNDIQFLVPLPLKPYQVLGSKFLIVMLFEYFTAIPVMLPPVIIYGIRTGIGVGAGVIAGTGSGMALDAVPGVAVAVGAGAAVAAGAGAASGAGMVAGVIVAALYWI